MLHPDDSHLLDDWNLYGPKSHEIFELVRALAGKGLRVEAIEDEIAAFLRAKLHELDTRQPGRTGHPDP